MTGKKLRVENRADKSPLDDVQDGSNISVVPSIVENRQRLSGGFSFFEHPRALRHGDRHRFVHEGVFPGSQTLDSDR